MENSRSTSFVFFKEPYENILFSPRPKNGKYNGQPYILGEKNKFQINKVNF